MKLNKKAATDQSIWQIIEWIVLVLLLVFGVYFILKFNLLDKLRVAIPGFGNASAKVS
jgi:hypothetical protein